MWRNPDESEIFWEECSPLDYLSRDQWSFPNGQKQIRLLFYRGTISAPKRRGMDALSQKKQLHQNVAKNG